MISFSDLKREAAFLSKQRYVVFFLLVALALSIFSVWSGVAETRAQIDTIERLLEKDAIDREDALSKQSDYGSAAYYSFHLTYSEPSPMAFAAMGQRDIYPWKHRVRMLAIEGQIYETDADNPELSFLGRFDFAFLISVLLPLFVILLLHDLRSSEREAGRFDLLIVTAKEEKQLWLSRALTMSLALALVLLIPFLIGVLVTGASATEIGLMLLVVLGHLGLWTIITLFIGNPKRSSSQSSARIASRLLAVWLLFTVLIPVGSDTVINELVESPSGGEIVLTQREAVNDAWDVPFSETWRAFLATHPEWESKTSMNSQFEWKWYYAFQQVGDQKAAELSHGYREATQQKDTVASIVALFSPPMLTQRLMSSIAGTNISSSLAYEQRVRDYHASLRSFYYPLLFNDGEFSHQALSGMPIFGESQANEAESSD
ncbi:DUF3526 domain-containing protein [Alteromonadaceae bacterium M269]|nr:DUF3526 domain-containing protein [Alteromonadaceae bacterium M269]